MDNDEQVLSLRAGLVPATVNDEDRSVEITFATSRPVLRMDPFTGERFMEVLSLKPEHVRLDRINSGAPLLDSHASSSVSGVMGAVVPGSAKVTRAGATARVRFSKREAVEPVWQDVRDGILNTVSVGYVVHAFTEKRGSSRGELPVRTATDWEPAEVSLAPIPSDIGAVVRGKKQMEDEKVIETQETITEPNERDLGVDQENERTLAILQATRAARLPVSFGEGLIQKKVPLVDAQRAIFEELAKRDVPIPRPGAGPIIEHGDDNVKHVREGIKNAILHRAYPKQPDGKGFELDEKGRVYRGYSLLEMARSYFTALGARIEGLSKMEVAALALGVPGLETRAGMHTTSDFPLLLADVLGKTLRRAYDEAPQTFAPFSRRVTLPDFKETKRNQLGEAPTLDLVGETGEFTRGTIGEAREKYALATYGKVFAISRQVIVNDDMDAFSRVPMLFGRQARNKESDLVWLQITSNPTMGDGNPLFDTTNHGNLSATSDAISVTSIGAARAAMRKQTGVDKKTKLNIRPVYLLVPVGKETLADQFVSTNLLASQATNVNPFAGKLTVIAEPRLDDASAVSWYLFASVDQIDVIEYAFLEGEEGPAIESRSGFDIDGLEIKVRHDVAAKAIDWRGMFKNPGA